MIMIINAMIVCGIAFMRQKVRKKHGSSLVECFHALHIIGFLLVFYEFLSAMSDAAATATTANA